MVFFLEGLLQLGIITSLFASQETGVKRPMGIIQSVPPGYIIEQFAPTYVVDSCYGEDKPDVQSFKNIYWKDFVQPFMRHTVKGLLYYQGLFVFMFVYCHTL